MPLERVETLEAERALRAVKLRRLVVIVLVGVFAERRYGGEIVGASGFG